MQRREFITLLGGAAAAWPLTARAIDGDAGLGSFYGSKRSRPSHLTNKRIDAMGDMTIRLDQTEEEILTYKVSDEALETAAGMGSKQEGNNTLVCTFFHFCPI